MKRLSENKEEEKVIFIRLEQQDAGQMHRKRKQSH